MPSAAQTSDPSTGHSRIISGIEIAASIVDKVKTATANLLTQTGVVPGLAVVIVGTDPASQIYVRSKSRKARDCGFKSVEHTLPADVSEPDLLALVAGLNADESVHGILIQLPLPAHLDVLRVTQAILPTKDVDGFHLENIGKLSFGAIDDCLIPCTPAGCMVMIREVLGSDLSGKQAVVIGRSNIVGKPMIALLAAANGTVTGVHSRSPDIAALCRTADIVVAAVGRPGFVRRDWLKPGAVVIDVGINRLADDGSAQHSKARIIGDVAFDECLEVAGAITPVPGGVGPMTIAMLMANTMRAAHRAVGREAPRFA